MSDNSMTPLQRLRDALARTDAALNAPAPTVREIIESEIADFDMTTGSMIFSMEQTACK